MDAAGREAQVDEQKNLAFHRMVGKRITQHRQEQQMTQAELARMLGVSQQSVFAYELGDRGVRIDFLPTLAMIFGTSTEELLGIKPTAPPRKNRVSGRLARHVERIKQMDPADQRFIIRLAETIASRQSATLPSRNCGHGRRTTTDRQAEVRTCEERSAKD